MKKKKDVFKKSNADYDTFVNQLYDAVNTNHIAWGIDPLIVAAILALLTPWSTFWAISKKKSASTSADKTNTRLARKALTAYLRPFVQTWIYRNTSMTDADIIICGLDPHDRVKSPVGKPATEPDMDYKYSGTHQLSAYYKQAPAEPGVSGRGKPAGVASVKIVYFIGDNPPADPAEFPKFIIGTRTPVKILFNATDAGKKVTLAACWVSTSNIDGDWTAVITLIIP
jgi:hypothetical protein